MARLTIEDRWWTDPRRERLSELVGGIDQADVVAVKAWRLAQEFWKQAFGLVPKILFDRLKHPAALVDAGLAEVRGDTVYVRGSEDYLTWAAEMREAASIGGRVSAQRPRDAQGRLLKSSKRTPSSHQANSKAHQGSDSDSDSDFDSDLDSDSGNLARPSEKSASPLVLETEEEAGKGGARPDGGSATALAWRAYRDAFEKRHGKAPPWNSKTAGMLSHFVKRIPASAAPDVAAFYLTHNDAYYIRSMHPVAMLLKDAEKLYTEWQTGRTVTGTGARQAEKFGHAADQIRRIREGTL